MTLDPEHEDVYRRVSRGPLAVGGDPFALDTAGIEAILPHRPPLRLLDSVTALSRLDQSIACRRTLMPDDPVFAGHFPRAPIYPGVLHIEAIGQAGVLLHQLVHRDGEPLSTVKLTHVRAAHFLRPLHPDDEVDVIVVGLQDGLFYTVVGQCVVRGQVASVAAVSAIL